MQKRVPFVIAVFVSLFTAPAWGQSLGIWPNQFYVYDVENFIRLTGPSLGTESTVVTYTNGSTVLSVSPQLDSSAPVLSEVWVPIGVSVTVGRWEVRVIATDVGGAERTYGPAPLDIVERPVEPPPPPALPEVLLVEASPSGTGATFDSGGATCDYESGAPLPVGTTTVTCTLGSTTQTFTIVVSDTVAPVLTLPANILSTDHVVTFTASAVDAIDGPVPVDCAPASGSTFPDGATTVQCVTADTHANATGGTFTVTVATMPPPVLHLPPDFTAEATGPGGAVVTYVATADGGTIQCVPGSGSLFPLGATTVNCSATNVAGTSTGSFKVTVLDRTAPIVTATTPSESTLWPPNHKMHGICVSVVASDLVDPAPTSQIVSVSSNQPVGDGTNGDKAPDWVITGPLSVDLRAERTAPLGARVYTITVATSDRTGNTSLSTTTVTVPHNN